MILGLRNGGLNATTMSRSSRDTIFEERNSQCQDKEDQEECKKEGRETNAYIRSFLMLHFAICLNDTRVWSQRKRQKKARCKVMLEERDLGGWIGDDL